MIVDQTNLFFATSFRTMASKLLSKSARLTSRLTHRCRVAFSTSVQQSDYLEFDTLHSLNSNAVKKYESNPLFGTFRNDKFEWMTYGEFGTRVEKCRALLSDVGKLNCSIFVLYMMHG